MDSFVCFCAPAIVVPSKKWERNRNDLAFLPSVQAAIPNRLFIRWWTWFNRFFFSFFGEHVFCGHTFKLFSHYNRIRNRAENLFSPPFFHSTFVASSHSFFFVLSFRISHHPQKNSHFFYWQFNGIIVFEIFNIFRCSNDVLTALPVFEWLL